MPIRSGTSVPDCITANETLLVRLRFTGSRSILAANATKGDEGRNERTGCSTTTST